MFIHKTYKDGKLTNNRVMKGLLMYVLLSLIKLKHYIFGGIIVFTQIYIPYPHPYVNMSILNDISCKNTHKKEKYAFMYKFLNPLSSLKCQFKYLSFLE